MAGQSSQVPTQARQFDSPSGLRDFARQRGFIADAVIRLQVGSNIDASDQDAGISRNLHKECGDWLGALHDLPKLNEVKKIELYCEPALITQWMEMRDNFAAAIGFFERGVTKVGFWEIVFLN